MGDDAGSLGTPADAKGRKGKSPLLPGGLVPARERMRGAGGTTPLDEGGAEGSSTTNEHTDASTSGCSTLTPSAPIGEELKKNSARPGRQPSGAWGGLSYTPLETEVRVAVNSSDVAQLKQRLSMGSTPSTGQKPTVETNLASPLASHTAISGSQASSSSSVHSEINSTLEESSVAESQDHSQTDACLLYTSDAADE